ncbi:hypothetical protein ACTXT7_015778 [Hymenolepis weldensis]
MSERLVESGTQTTQVQSDAQATDLNVSPEAPTVTTKYQLPGFILLSVKHEKVREAPPPTRKISNGHKGSGAPTHKISRKRLRKMTPSSLNSGALFVDGVGFLSAEDASRFTSNMTEQSSSLSRFRVTRIADASSWWIPNNSSMNISVHDLKTSSLPDFVTRQYQKMQSDVSYTSQDRTKWIRDIRKYMEPNFPTKISEAQQRLCLAGIVRPHIIDVEVQNTAGLMIIAVPNGGQAVRCGLRSYVNEDDGQLGDHLQNCLSQFAFCLSAFY